jgi:hypothetical protein
MYAHESAFVIVFVILLRLLLLLITIIIALPTLTKAPNVSLSPGRLRARQIVARTVCHRPLFHM